VTSEIKQEWLENQAEKVKEEFADGFQWGDLATVIKIGMESIELVKGLSSQEKEEMVIDLLCRVIDVTKTGWDWILDPIAKRIVRYAGPGLIKLVCGASKGEVAINK